MRNVGSVLSVGLVLGLVLAALPATATSHSPYAGNWKATFKVTSVGNPACYDSSALNQEQPWADSFAVDGSGRFALDGAQGTITDGGVVGFTSPAGWTGCYVSGSGSCSSTSSCGGTMSLRRSPDGTADQAEWRFTRIGSTPTATQPTPTSTAASGENKAAFDYSFRGRTPCTYEKLTFTDASTNQAQITGRDWNRDGFVNEFGANMKSVSYTFWQPGPHKIQLTVTWQGGSQQTTSMLDYSVIDCSGSTTGPTPTPGQSSPYAGTWNMKYTVNTAGRCYDSSSVGREQSAGNFSIGPDGRFDLPGGGTSAPGTVDPNGNVRFDVKSDNSNCSPGEGSGQCASTSFCSGRFTAGAGDGTWKFVRLGGTGSGNSAPYAKFSASNYRPCLGERVGFQDHSYDPDAGDGIRSRAWQLGPFTPPGDAYVEWTPANPGTYTVTLTVMDSQSVSARTFAEITVYDCRQSPPPPTATMSTSSYSARCEQLQRDRAAFESDWKYRYSSYYQRNPSPSPAASFESSMATERENYLKKWESEYNAAGCGGTSMSADCQRGLDAARADLEYLRSHAAELRRQYEESYSQAKGEFFRTEPHTDEERRAFFERWSSRMTAISTGIQDSLLSILEKYGIRNCPVYWGEYGDSAAPVPSTTPRPADAYTQERMRCEELIAGQKREFEAIAAKYYEALRTKPTDSAEYREAKAAIARLEAETATMIQQILEKCRATYASAYQAPSTYKDTRGTLSCFAVDDSGRIVCSGRFIGFSGNPQTQVLYSYTCAGQPFFDQFYANAAFERFDFATDTASSSLVISGANLRLILTDGARGVINAGAFDGAQIYFVIAPGLNVSADPNGFLVQGLGGKGYWVGDASSLAWDPVKRIITVKGKASWAAESCHANGAKPDGDADGKYWEAIRERRLGAQVVITLSGDDVSSDDEKYDEDMDVRVQKAGNRKYQAIIDSSGEDCKTVVLKFDGDIFSTIKLKVTLQDDEGNELSIQEASNLEDVLDPCNDGPQGFEYWIVVDKYGTQVLVSFAHFSEKRVSVEAAAVGNIGVPGFEVGGLVVAGLVALAVAARRRLTR